MKKIPEYKKQVLLRLFNKLLFIKKQIIDPTDMNAVSKIIVQDFLVILHKLFVINMKSIGVKEFSYEEALRFFIASNKDTAPEEIMKSSVEIISNMSKHGMGFSPGMINYSKTKFQDLNCLGKSAVLGALFHAMGYEIKLGLLTDHAVVIMYLDSGIYFCDPTNNIVKKLHGTIVEHPGYDWYTVTRKDQLEFGHVVFQDFHLGITHAIFESLETYSIKLRNLKGDTWKSMEYARPTLTFGWHSVRTKFFSELNKYKEDYQIEYLREYLLTTRLRKLEKLQNRYINLLYKVMEKILETKAANLKSEDVSEFLKKAIPIMKLHTDAVLEFFDKGTKLPKVISGKERMFLELMFKFSNKDAPLRECVYHQMKVRLKKKEKKLLTKQ